MDSLLDRGQIVVECLLRSRWRWIADEQSLDSCLLDSRWIAVGLSPRQRKSNRYLKRDNRYLKTR